MIEKLERREFITLVGGAVACPLAARAQQPAMPAIGFLSSLSAPVTSKRIASFGQGLSETGYVVGRDVTVEARMAEGQYDRLPALAADLAGRQVSLIAALAPPAAFAAKTATTIIPIVFVGGVDPVKAGLVASLNRPGGNVTGVTFIGASLGVKRLELARELVPNVRTIALLTHPNSPDALEELRELQSAATAIGQQLLVVSATSDRDFEVAFASIAQQRAGVLLIGQDPFFFQAGGQLVALAARHRIPAIYGNSELVNAGALLSYGASVPDAWRLAGVYAGKILKGARPADLPVVQPTKFELVLNLNTARVPGVQAENRNTNVGIAKSIVGRGKGKRIGLAGPNKGTSFLRPEDGAWDPRKSNVFYFVTTDRNNFAADGTVRDNQDITQIGRSRLWAVTFDDVTKIATDGTPTAKLEMLLDGTEGGDMFDNIAVDRSGVVYLCEDPGNSRHNAKSGPTIQRPGRSPRS